jgi:hypothetical protein
VRRTVEETTIWEAQMSTVDRAILLFGRDAPADVTIDEASRYGQVYVVARAVSDRSDRWLTDDDRNHASANARLVRVLGQLRARGASASGDVGDPDVDAALSDARAFFPAAEAILPERTSASSRVTASDCGDSPLMGGR